MKHTTYKWVVAVQDVNSEPTGLTLMSNTLRGFQIPREFPPDYAYSLLYLCKYQDGCSVVSIPVHIDKQSLRPFFPDGSRVPLCFRKELRNTTWQIPQAECPVVKLRVNESECVAKVPLALQKFFLDQKDVLFTYKLETSEFACPYLLLTFYSGLPNRWCDVAARAVQLLNPQPIY